jgi:hypothetical protein
VIHVQYSDYGDTATTAMSGEASLEFGYSPKLGATRSRFLYALNSLDGSMLCWCREARF